MESQVLHLISWNVPVWYIIIFVFWGREHSTAGQVIRELVPCISSHATTRKKSEPLSPYRSMGGSQFTPRASIPGTSHLQVLASLWQCYPSSSVSTSFQRWSWGQTMPYLYLSVLTMKIDGSSVDSVLMSCVLYGMCFLRGRRGWDIWSLAVPTVRAGTVDGKQNPVVQPGSSFLHMPQSNTLLWHFILQFATCLCSTFQHTKWDKMSGLMTLDLESLPFTFLWQCPWVPRSFHIKSLEHKVVNYIAFLKHLFF